MKFDTDKDIPDLAGKVIIVTGGSSGLGKESVRQLAKNNPAKTYVSARTAGRGSAAITEIEAEIPEAVGKLQFLELDLESFASIQKAVETFLSDNNRLDILMNNTRSMASPPGLTKDRYEVQFGSSHVGPALLTALLLPILLKTAEKTGDVRVVNLSSPLYKQAPAEGFIISKLKNPMTEISSESRYGHSKLGYHYHTKAMATKYPSIKFVALHTGVVATGVLDNLKKRRPWPGGALVMVWNTVICNVKTVARDNCGQLLAPTRAKRGVVDFILQS